MASLLRMLGTSTTTCSNKLDLRKGSIRNTKRRPDDEQSLECFLQNWPSLWPWMGLRTRSWTLFGMTFWKTLRSKAKRSIRHSTGLKESTLLYQSKWTRGFKEKNKRINNNFGIHSLFWIKHKVILNWCSRAHGYREEGPKRDGKKVERKRRNEEMWKRCKMRTWVW